MTVILPTPAPLAVVHGEPLATLPDDLYIPPDALEVMLEAFEGPLDVLLYLIRRQQLNICDIPIAEITQQYMGYVELMQEFRLDLAADYLVMAALLAEIKSRLLLPQREFLEEEDDPRADLVRRLQEYEHCRQAALDLDQLPRCERDVWPARTNADFPSPPRPLPDVSLPELLAALQSVLKRADSFSSHQIRREQLSIRERMTRVLDLLQQSSSVHFAALFVPEEGRRGVVVALMAVLELLKAHLIEVQQTSEYGVLIVCLPSRSTDQLVRQQSESG